jgi:hypothetical protein
LPPYIQSKSRMRERARTDLCGGRRAIGVPTATKCRQRPIRISKAVLRFMNGQEGRPRRCSRACRTTARNLVRIRLQCARGITRRGIGSSPEIKVETIAFFVFPCPLVLIRCSAPRLIEKSMTVFIDLRVGYFIASVPSEKTCAGENDWRGERCHRPAALLDGRSPGHFLRAGWVNDGKCRRDVESRRVLVLC